MTGSMPRPAEAGYWAGVGAGGVAALSWSIYNVAAKFGTAQGFQAQDLMLARFVGAGVLMLPFLLRYGVRGGIRNPGGIGWARAIVLTALIGPLFGLLVGVGFVLTPLAHGLVVGPSATMIATSLLGCWFAGEPITGRRIAGIAILVLGLLALAWDGVGAALDGAAGGGMAGSGTAMDGMVVVGDLAFVAAAWLWGGFTLLVVRWGIDPLRGTAAVGVLSMAVVLPVYFAVFDLPPVSAVHWVHQAAFQGGLGGCVAVFAYGLAVERLGSVRASLFPSMVPPLGILIAVPVLGQVPGTAQIAGVVLASVGLAIGLGGLAMPRRGRHRVIKTCGPGSRPSSREEP